MTTTEPRQRPAALTITETEAGKRLSVVISGDKRPGVTEITFRNQGKKPHSAQLIGVRGMHSAADPKRVFAATSDGKPIPDWFRAAGDVGTTGPGETSTVTQELGSGTYYVVDDEDDDNIDTGGLTKLEISGDRSGGSLSASGAKVTAIDYGFKTSGLKAGRNTVLFDNTGKEPHHVVAAPINPGKTIADVRKAVQSEQQPEGPPPADFENGVSTSVIDGGRKLAAELELKRGKYALLCFIADRDGGPPHVAKGMVSEATIE